MAFRICMVKDRRGLDALPVAKVLHYPMERRDYRPFAQNILCISEGSLVLRMWAFEVSPLPGSELRAVLYPFSGARNPALHMRAVVTEAVPGTPRFEAFLLYGDGRRESVGADFRSHGGEDLQGVYWGVDAVLSFDSLERAGGKLLCGPGSMFPGNFYKTCEAQGSRHYGSFAPADWNKPYGLESMGAFEIVGY